MEDNCSFVTSIQLESFSTGKPPTKLSAQQMKQIAVELYKLPVLRKIIINVIFLFFYFLIFFRP